MALWIAAIASCYSSISVMQNLDTVSMFIMFGTLVFFGKIFIVFVTKDTTFQVKEVEVSKPAIFDYEFNKDLETPTASANSGPQKSSDKTTHPNHNKIYISSRLSKQDKKELYTPLSLRKST